MGTNYYFRIKAYIKLDEVDEKNNPLLYSTFNEIRKFLNEVTLVHIGKRAPYWKPLFQTSKYFSSVKEMKDFYYKNKTHLCIEDEYGKKITFEELETELINWNRGNDDVNHHSDCFFDSDGYAFVAYDFT